MKRLIVIISIMIFFIIGVFLLYRWNKNFLLLWNSNIINVQTDSFLTKDKVKIEFGNGVTSINRVSDYSIFSNREKYTIIYDGKIKELLDNEYGENDFLITYDNQYYFVFRHFKRNRRHQHNYNFYFFRKNGKIFIRADIQGVDKLIIESPMPEINLADKLYYNNPKKDKSNKSY